MSVTFGIEAINIRDHEAGSETEPESEPDLKPDLKPDLAPDLKPDLDSETEPERLVLSAQGEALGQRRPIKPSLKGSFNPRFFPP